MVKTSYRFRQTDFRSQLCISISVNLNNVHNFWLSVFICQKYFLLRVVTIAEINKDHAHEDKQVIYPEPVRARE